MKNIPIFITRQLKSSKELKNELLSLFEILQSTLHSEYSLGKNFITSENENTLGEECSIRWNGSAPLRFYCQNTLGACNLSSQPPHHQRLQTSHEKQKISPSFRTFPGEASILFSVGIMGRLW